MRTRLAALVVAVLTLAGVPVAGASSAADRTLEYVALGDSYSAASGVLPLDLTAPPACLRSLRNYPNVVARRTGAVLTDVTCGGAETTDFFTAQYPGVAPQLDALSSSTDLVTMTIGGNDGDVFIGAILACGAAGVVTLGRGSPCQDRYGDSFATDIRTLTYPAVVRALRAVHRRAPDAEVAIVGYPWITPERRGCFARMPIARGDVPYLRDIQALLNRKIKQAARATGSTYVNMNRVSDGHDACQPLGVRWIEPVLWTTNPVVVHPNALGEAKIAARVIRVLGLG